MKIIALCLIVVLIASCGNNGPDEPEPLSPCTTCKLDVISGINALVEIRIDGVIRDTVNIAQPRHYEVAADASHLVQGNVLQVGAADFDTMVMCLDTCPRLIVIMLN